MSKLPVVSGSECIKALGKVGFEVYRQRGSHIVLVRKSPPTQTTIPNHKRVGSRYATRDHQANWSDSGGIRGVALSVGQSNSRPQPARLLHKMLGIRFCYKSMGEVNDAFSKWSRRGN